MALFLTHLQEDKRLYFDEEVSHHLGRSLRKQIGDTIHATDGAGTVFTARIDTVAGDNVEATVLKREFISKKWEVHVACSLIKKESRFEYFLEKATETGIHHITPLICQRTQKPRMRYERARKIIDSAVQQSFNPYVPILDNPLNFQEYIGQPTLSHHERYIATAVDRGNEVLLEQQYSGKNPVHILIGPEGDFTAEEVRLAEEAGWKKISLGQNRLRTETAATMVVQIIKSCHNIKTTDA